MLCVYVKERETGREKREEERKEEWRGRKRDPEI